VAAPAFLELRTDRSERDLIDRARAGDMTAFEAIYRMHSPTVYALCLRLSAGVGSDATELLQDVFVRAWRGLASFRGDSALSSWLHRLTVNAMLERARGNSRRLARVIPIEEESGFDAPSMLEDPDLRMDLESAIAQLPEGARVAFVLHDIEGFQHQEIAAQLGVATGTIKAQVHRAHKLLIKALDR
jgi:RNA polymerase sigma-70 factor (ECF subfamily)